MGLFLRKILLLKMLGLTFSSKLDWSSYILSIAESASKNIGALIRYMKFLFPEACPCLCKPGHVWSAVVMSGLVILVAT